MSNQFFMQTIEAFKKFSEVDVITLGGSRAAGWFDASSDYDVYVYLNSDLPEEKRRAVLRETCVHADLGKTHWGVYWDDCRLRGDTSSETQSAVTPPAATPPVNPALAGVPLEINYFTLHNTRNNLENHLIKHIAHNGYTTCTCFTVFNAKILYDPRGLYAALVREFTMPYPEPLRKNIVTLNRELLQGITPSYYNQIEKAITRNDAISVNHRIASFLAIYFDIIFALNRQFHPGEKRLIELCRKMCDYLPADFEENVHGLLAANGDTLSFANKLVQKLDCLIGPVTAPQKEAHSA